MMKQGYFPLKDTALLYTTYGRKKGGVREEDKLYFLGSFSPNNDNKHHKEDNDDQRKDNPEELLPDLHR